MSVFGLASAVAGFVKVRYLIDKAVIDNMVFRAHYRTTAAILFACCIIVTANNLIGKWSSALLPFSSAPMTEKPPFFSNTFDYICFNYKELNVRVG